jgi:hypothetical protein
MLEMGAAMKLLITEAMLVETLTTQEREAMATYVEPIRRRVETAAGAIEERLGLARGAIGTTHRLRRTEDGEVEVVPDQAISAANEETPSALQA